MVKMVKEKLTLSVDKYVVEKAKKLGINISEITEKVLRGYTSAEKPSDDLYSGYEQLFTSITPLLKEFDVCVVIAEDLWARVPADSVGDLEVGHFTAEIELTPDGSFWIDTMETNFDDIRKIQRHQFLSPKEILANLVDALVKSHQTRKEKMKEILMAKRIIDAMSETLIEREHMKTAQSKDMKKSRV